MQKKQKQSGFTLVELAIVLVIIGLIVGGVLVGQDLIKAATLRAATAQLDKIDAAANTFRNKYNALPGDLPNPTSFFASVTGDDPTAAGLGNGDGAVQADDDAACTGNTACISGEAAVFWYELAQAGLITEPITNVGMAKAALAIDDNSVPQSKLGKGARVTVNSIAGRNYYVLGNASGTTAATGLATWAAGISGIDAYNLDTKVDDGVPTTGKLLSVDAATPVANTAANGVALAAPPAAGDCYITDSTPAPRYNTAGSLADEMNCNVGIRSSF